MLSNCLGVQFWGKLLTRTTSNFCFFFGHSAENFRPDSNMFLPRKWKTHSTDAEDQFWGTIFQKKGVIYVFWEFAQKIVKCPANLFRQNCQNCLFWFQRNNVGLCFFSKNYQLIVFVGFWVKNSAISPNLLQ